MSVDTGLRVTIIHPRQLMGNSIYPAMTVIGDAEHSNNGNRLPDNDE